MGNPMGTEVVRGSRVVLAIAAAVGQVVLHRCIRAAGHTGAAIGQQFDIASEHELDLDGCVDTAVALWELLVRLGGDRRDCLTLGRPVGKGGGSLTRPPAVGHTRSWHTRRGPYHQYTAPYSGPLRPARPGREHRPG
jgi:hypothetical protein